MNLQYDLSQKPLFPVTALLQLGANDKLWLGSQQFCLQCVASMTLLKSVLNNNYIEVYRCD